MVLPGKTGRAIALALGLVMAGATPAQAQSSKPKSYPNTEGFGREVAPDTPWLKECLRVEHVKPPESTPAAPANCKAYNYYDKKQQAVTANAEWTGVRACALAAGDNDVLAMLYANGRGVERNLDLATQYACRAGGAYFEVAGRIEHLQELRKGAAGTDYDQCDDATSGYMTGICARIADDQAEKVRIGYLARLRRQLPAPQVAAYDQLLATANAFADARENETDLSGSARAMQVIQAQAREKEWLREHLVAFEKGGAGPTPVQTLALADAELNRVYKALMAAPSGDKDQPDGLSYGTVSKTDVRTTQRLWLAYRDAWVRFAALRYPAMSADALKALLTEWRTKQLARMA